MVMYHRYVEIAGAKNNITYDLHDVEFNTEKKIAVVKCIAKHKDRTITTYGEASPFNCKNAYTVSMAEKRAVDRAILKLLGIHGFVYSEDEIDNTESLSSKSLDEVEAKIIKMFTSKGIEECKDFWKHLSPEYRKSLRERESIIDIFTPKR